MGFFRQGSTYEEKKLKMVENQLKSRGISDQNVLNAMQEIPRDMFVPAQYKVDAYKDGPLPIGEGQTISQPYMVALMTECLKLHPNDKVLEIGTGSGYQMAVLLHITPHVYSIERVPKLGQQALDTLKSIGYPNIHIKVGDGTCGWPEEAPFDAIIVTSAAPSIPETLKAQLADGGRLVIPMGSRHMQTLYIVTKKGNHFDTVESTTCVFVPLIGQYGWSE